MAMQHTQDDDITTASVPGQSEFLNDVIQGLTHHPKTLPCKYYYDAKGSVLFDQICELDAYYPTRTELSILEQYLPSMIEAIGPRSVIVEPGSGSSLKVKLLLEQLREPVAYVPVEISEEHLIMAAESLRREFPHIPILPVVADYTKPFTLPSFPSSPERVLAYYPGSTIGNFMPREATQFLRRLHGIVGLGGGLLIGVDRKKDKSVLELAYNDPEQLTDEFHFNLLRRINDELHGNFVVDDFQHQALYNEDVGRIEMHLRSRKKQQVDVSNHSFSFAEGESICTEYSYKYTPEEFQLVAQEAGFSLQQMWTDEREYFSIYLFDAVEPSPEQTTL